jgi:hypothetical protein
LSSGSIGEEEDHIGERRYSNMDEEKETQEEPTSEDTGEGSEPEADEQAEKLRAKNERLEKQVKKREELIAKNKELMAQETLGGESEAGQKKPEPKKESDDEYAERVRQGKANPLKDDGFIA